MKIDGKAIAQELLDDLQKRVILLKEKNCIPHLAIILVGNDPASEAYVAQKQKKAEQIGMQATVIPLLATVSHEELLSEITTLNKNSFIHGVIVQRPLPKQIDGKEIDMAIDPKKDVDGFHKNSPFAMPLAEAVVKILQVAKTKAEDTSDFSTWLQKKRIVVVGKGETGGGPIITLLTKLGNKPEVIDSKTKNPNEQTKKANIIISAVGKTDVVKAENIENGVILVSVGLHREVDGKLHGDYEEEKIKNIASFFTPTPGGVGPVNVAMLLENVISAAENT